MIKNVVKLFGGGVFAKVLGVFRELLVASLYGTGVVAGSFRVALTVTLVPINFFTSDMLSAGFIPLYARFKSQDTKKAQSLFWLLMMVVTFFSIALTVMLYFNAEALVGYVVPGFDSAGKSTSVLFVQIMSYGVPFYVVSQLCSCLALANNLYLLMSIRPAIQSLGMILGALVSYSRGEVVFFAWGFSIAYVVYFLFALRLLWLNSLLDFSLKWSAEIIREFWVVIRPLLLLPFLLQGGIVAEKIVASYIGIQAVAAIDYAKFITETVVFLMAIPLGYVVLSTFSGLSEKDVSKKIIDPIRVVIVISIPVSIFVACFSDLIISTIFERGAFLKESVNVSSKVLIGLSIGLWAQVVSYVMIKVFNAQSRNREVVFFTSLAILANVIFNFVFYKKLGVLAIGLGVSVYSILLFALCTLSLGLVQSLLPLLAVMAVGGLFCFLLMSTFNGLYVGAQLVEIIVFVVFWCIYVFSIPVIRSTISPYISKFKVRV
ncbi:murein biosynthesis integral membrane protein MurJ [Teredinibacter haidensis]|uniref:murein biosynthesis integral membrane protein MurJ n=1 Tax=Teredinibacter haidensis TaxID=2731755 RepID=UPI000948DD8C|nr:lipid II flippase MurJ [Teredinibacter haidensis]